MKKTIITLLAWSSISMAAEPALVWDLDFDSTGVVFTSYVEGVTSNLNSGVGSTLISNGAITLNNDAFSFKQTGGNLSYSDEFTLLVKVQMGKANNNYPIIFSLGESTAWNWKPSFYQNNNKFVLDKEGFFNVVNEDNKDIGAIGYTIPENGYGDVVTLALQNNGEGKLTLFVDGKQAGYTTITSANEFSSAKLIKEFKFGGKLSGTNNDANIILHDAQFVSGLTTQIIPEPTTATLSLLALAGLAARRRRASR